MKNKTQTIMEKAMEDPKYRGKHIIVAEGKVYAATTRTVSRVWDEVKKKHPKAVLEYSFTPKGSLTV